MLKGDTLLATHAITQSDLVFVLIVLAILVLLFWLFGRFRP